MPIIAKTTPLYFGKMGVMGKWPSVPAVYLITKHPDNFDQSIFLGDTEDLARTVGELLENRDHCIHRYDATGLAYEELADEALRKQRLEDLIEEYKPPFNLRTRRE